MDRNDIKAMVGEIIVKTYKVEPDAVTEDLRWIDDLNSKSMQAMKVLALTKLKFPDANFTLDDLSACTTVGDMIDKLESSAGA